jgi:hypothetical protein
MSMQVPLASLEQLQIQQFNVVLPTEQEVAGGVPPLLKLEMLLAGGFMLKWCFIDPRVAQGLGRDLAASGEKCANYKPGPNLIIADQSSQQVAERFYDGLNRPQG